MVRDESEAYAARLRAAGVAVVSMRCPNAHPPCTAAQVAPLDYVPAGWPAGTRVMATRVRYDAAVLSADPRSRRSRTVGKHQLALVLDGIADTAYAYSFIATNEELDLDEEIAGAEWEFHRHTRIEELSRAVGVMRGAGGVRRGAREADDPPPVR